MFIVFGFWNVFLHHIDGRGFELRQEIRLNLHQRLEFGREHVALIFQGHDLCPNRMHVRTRFFNGPVAADLGFFHDQPRFFVPVFFDFFGRLLGRPEHFLKRILHRPIPVHL